MGLTFTSPDDLHSLWGADPVHPTAAAYDTMATNLIDEIDSDTVLHSRLPSGGQTDPGLTAAPGPFAGNQWAPRETSQAAPKPSLYATTIPLAEASEAATAPKAAGAATGTMAEVATPTTREAEGDSKNVYNYSNHCVIHYLDL